MLRSLKAMSDFAIEAIDGHVGKMENFYFDDESWVARYLVVETEKPAYLHRHVLISPISVQNVDEKAKAIHLGISQEKVQNSPNIDTEKTVTRQREIEHSRYYNHPAYWKGMGIWGGGGYPYELNSEHSLYDPAWAVVTPESSRVKLSVNDPNSNHIDPHLRSANEVVGYGIHATDGDIGHVEDILIDRDTWAVRYLVVKTGHWWKGAHLLILPRAIDKVSWAKSKVMVSLTRDAVKLSPQFKSIVDLNRSTGHAS